MAGCVLITGVHEPHDVCRVVTQRVNLPGRNLATSLDRAANQLRCDHGPTCHRASRGQGSRRVIREVAVEIPRRDVVERSHRRWRFDQARLNFPEIAADLIELELHFSAVSAQGEVNGRASSNREELTHQVDVATLRQTIRVRRCFLVGALPPVVCHEPSLRGDDALRSSLLIHGLWRYFTEVACDDIQIRDNLRITLLHYSAGLVHIYAHDLLYRKP